MDASTIDLIGSRFGLGPVTGSRAVRLVRHDRAAWRIDGTDRSYFVKVLKVGTDHEAFLAGKEFELSAFEAGLDLPRPISTLDGAAVLVLGDRMITVHDWIDAVGATDDIDLSTWAGCTLARMAELRPARDVTSWCYRLPSAERWAQFVVEGRRQGEPWAYLLERRLPLLDRTAVDIDSALTRFGPVAVMHPDLEPHNVIASPVGLRLVDWDHSTADSVPLVVAQATLQLSLRDGRPDADRVRTTIDAYRRAGGPALDPGPGLLMRRVALLLSRLAERIETCLGHDTGLAVPAARSTAAQRLVTLPTFVGELQRWERLFPRD